MATKIFTGIDIVEVDRIRESIDKDARFLIRFFGAEERALFNTKNMAERVAANFAAKEAFGKALGIGIVGFSLPEVQALRNEFGAPYLKLTGKALELSKDYEFSLSLSHTKTLATAIVIATIATKK